MSDKLYEIFYNKKNGEITHYVWDIWVKGDTTYSIYRKHRGKKYVALDQIDKVKGLYKDHPSIFCFNFKKGKYTLLKHIYDVHEKEIHVHKTICDNISEELKVLAKIYK